MPKAFWLQQYHDSNRSRAKKEYKTSETKVGLPNRRNDRQLDLCRARDGCAVCTRRSSTFGVASATRASDRLLYGHSLILDISPLSGRTSTGLSRVILPCLLLIERRLARRGEFENQSIVQISNDAAVLVSAWPSSRQRHGPLIRRDRTGDSVWYGRAKWRESVGCSRISPAGPASVEQDCSGPDPGIEEIGHRCCIAKLPKLAFGRKVYL